MSRAVVADAQGMLIDQLKSQGLIEKKKVILTKSAAVEKLLTNSLGKANSIRDIVFSEYDSMGSSLRLLILTDYIRKEYEKAIGNPEATIASLGVLPFFEMLRRENEKQHKAICAPRTLAPSMVPMATTSLAVKMLRS